MGVGMAKQDSKVLKAATEQLATIAGQQPSVRRARKSIAAFKLREGMPVGVRGDAARRARLRVPRPPGLDRDPPDPRLPRTEPALVRRPRQLLDGRQGADHLPRDRLRRDRPGARPGHHDHDERRQRRSRPTRCSRRSGCRSARRAAPRATTPRPTPRAERAHEEQQAAAAAKAAEAAAAGGRRAGPSPPPSPEPRRRLSRAEDEAAPEADATPSPRPRLSPRRRPSRARRRPRPRRAGGRC